MTGSTVVFKLKNVCTVNALPLPENFLEENANTKNTNYVVKTSKVKKNLMVFSTVEPVLGVNKDDNKKNSHNKAI